MVLAVDKSALGKQFDFYQVFCSRLLMLDIFCAIDGDDYDDDDVDEAVNTELSCDINTLSNRTRECSRARRAERLWGWVKVDKWEVHFTPVSTCWPGSLSIDWHTIHFLVARLPA